MKLEHLHAALALLLLAAAIGSVGRHAGDRTSAPPAATLAAAAPPPAPVNSIGASELSNQLAVPPEYIGLFPNEMATPAAAAVE